MPIHSVRLNPDMIPLLGSSDTPIIRYRNTGFASDCRSRPIQIATLQVLLAASTELEQINYTQLYFQHIDARLLVYLTRRLFAQLITNTLDGLSIWCKGEAIIEGLAIRIELG